MLEEAEDRWIDEHGLDAENPLVDEIARAVVLLRANPQLGVAYTRTVRTDIRRLLLRSGWHIYYRHDPTRALVEIVAIWFASRGDSPRL
jgi:plasmid stabilization system protein ParE